MKFPELAWSPEVQKQLNEEQAIKWTTGTINTSSQLFESFKNTIEDKHHDNIRLSGTFLLIAVESAYIDLLRIGFTHDLKGGPSPNKTAASITFWLNKVRPTQVVNELDVAEETWPVSLHSFFALFCGLRIKYGDSIQPGIVAEMIFENSGYKDMLYHLTWRSPTFKDICTMFELMRN